MNLFSILIQAYENTLLEVVILCFHFRLQWFCEWHFEKFDWAIDLFWIFNQDWKIWHINEFHHHESRHLLCLYQCIDFRIAVNFQIRSLCLWAFEISILHSFYPCLNLYLLLNHFFNLCFLRVLCIF